MALTIHLTVAKTGNGSATKGSTFAGLPNTDQPFISLAAMEK
jgi:hypothetical protein